MRGLFGGLILVQFAGRLLLRLGLIRLFRLFGESATRYRTDTNETKSHNKDYVHY